MTNIELQFMQRVPSVLSGIERNLDVRTMAAIMMAQAIINGKSYYPSAREVAVEAVDRADELISELNKTK